MNIDESNTCKWNKNKIDGHEYYQTGCYDSFPIVKGYPVCGDQDDG